MKPAERIPLLKKLATTLSADEMPWAEMNLVLRQHGFTSGDVWGEDRDGYPLAPERYEYALHHVENSGDDEKLLELARYLDPGDGDQSVPSSAGPGPWKGENTFRLFISHTHPNAPFAAEIRDYLGRVLIESFVAHNDIEPSEKWMRVIESALLTCHAAVAIVTPDFRESQWCDQEIGFCLARSRLVVPLMHDAHPHGFLSEFQGVKLNERSRPQTAAISVFRILATRPETRDRMVPSVVRRYSASKSHENTREAFTLLSQIPKDAWTPDLVFEVVRAGIQNPQVEDASMKNGTPVTDAAAKLLLPIQKRLDIVDDIPF
jgi:TIR domain